jgi:hypothetical protein
MVTKKNVPHIKNELNLSIYVTKVNKEDTTTKSDDLNYIIKTNEIGTSCNYRYRTDYQYRP